MDGIIDWLGIGKRRIVVIPCFWGGLFWLFLGFWRLLLIDRQSGQV